MVCSQSRGATVRALTALDLVVINREAFQELFGHLPGLKREIESVMAKRMGRPVDLCEEVNAAISDSARM